LIALGADLSLQDKRDLTALGHAMKANDKGTNEEMVEYLKNEMLVSAALREFRSRHGCEFTDKGVLKVRAR
jgi:hypothetical protein